MNKRVMYVSAIVLPLVLLYYFCLPSVLFTSPYSKVLQANKGELLTATIAADGQWRFPQSDTIPDKFVKALVAYEDKRFFSHPGLDVLAVARALQQNTRARKTVSGGSTITMQVIRLSRKNKGRTLFEKFVEVILATRLELRHSKSEIINLYAAHAPFGGNVVGLDAACWRYFGRSMHALSWSEAALLAVLPNAPSLLHPGKNRIALQKKRDALLDRLHANGTIDAFTCSLAKEESIPEKPLALPRYARHLLMREKNTLPSKSIVHATIDYKLQVQIEQLVEDHHKQLTGNEIHNAAALVLDVKTGNVLAYVGNVAHTQNNNYNNEVDIISAPRSTGSILKPFLFAAMLDEGKILPQTLLPDVPTYINGFSPKNFSKEYDGAVPADKALIRSLNVPAVYLLKEYRYEKFHTLLQNLGMTTLNNPADHYGLSLILGGAEGSLWDVTGMYASMARTLNNLFQHPGSKKYDANDWHEPIFVQSPTSNFQPLTSNLQTSSHLSASSIYQTFNILTEVYRPGEETGWRYFNSSKKIAWKTGTSYGFRDGWAVGVTPEYAVGVWVGNADGEGRPGLTGTDAAAPLLFSIFSALPHTTWFKQPTIEMQQTLLCEQSGYKAGAYCMKKDTVFVVKAGINSALCEHHQLVHLSHDLKFRVNTQCAAISQMKEATWFVLPPVQAYYYRTKNLHYKPLPPIKSGCNEAIASMDMIYPKHNARIFIPRTLTGTTGSIVFELAHSQPSAIVHWHLDETYIGTTKGIHQLAAKPAKGQHILTLVDATGQSFVRTFEVISGM
jgi:penicillin-binding protein 1C